MKKVMSLLLMLLLMTGSQAMADDDWENWSGISLKTQLSEKWGLSVFTQGRLRSDMGDLYYALVWPTLSYKVNDHWSLGLGYMYAEDENATTDKWDDEHRYAVRAIWTDQWEGFGLYNRFQFEYRDYHTDPRPRYRNRFKLSYKTELFGVKMTPYIWEEPFYDIEDHRFNQNRAAAGVVIPLDDQFSVNLYYMYMATKGADDWKGRNVLGSHLTIKF